LVTQQEVQIAVRVAEEIVEQAVAAVRGDQWGCWSVIQRGVQIAEQIESVVQEVRLEV